MIARLTRILLALQAAAILALQALASSLWHWSGAAALAFGCGALLLLRAGITANNFYLAARYRGPALPAFQLDWRASMRLFWQEFRATMLSSSWTMPFRRFRARPAATPRGLPVLLVHGYACNSGYWHAMSRALAQAGITHHALDLEPAFGSIDDYVPALQEAVSQLRAASGQDRIVVLAHSMGGLAVRAYLRRHGAGPIAKIITLGTPHHGTALARFGIGANARQMGWRGRNGQGQPSHWLRELAAAEPLRHRQLFVSIYSHHDNIFAPPASAHLPGAVNIELQGIGHVALALDASVQMLVIGTVLRAPSASTAPLENPASRQASHSRRS
jgi:triacylglycerol esterase/lipase EstA (alpha/beta hydrolase family)